MGPTIAQIEFHEQITEERAEHTEVSELDGLPEIQIYRDYARGKHKLCLSEEQKDILKGVLNNRFCDNVCHGVLDQARNRLKFERWSSENETVQKWLDDWYTFIRIEDRQSEIFYDMLRDSNTALSLSWDKDRKRVTVHRERWWDGDNGVFIGYNDLDEPYYAVKEWTVTNRETKASQRRRTVYFEDRFERWISDNGREWRPYVLPGETAWSQPWKKTDNTPLHIPYIHIPNAGRGELNYGTSELAGGVLGLQDQINDLQWAMSAAGRFTAFQLIWIAGIQLQLDENGKALNPPKIAPSSLLTSTNADTKFGHIPSGDLSQLINLYMVKLKAVSRMTGTPLHTITGGDWPSGEALLRAEQPAVGKAENQIKKLKQAMTLLAHRAIEIHNTYSTEEKLPDDIKTALIDSVFGSPERRDKLSKSVIVNNLGERISDREGLRIMDYTNDQAQKIWDEKIEEQRMKAEAFQDGFSRGTLPGTGLPTGNGSEDGEDGNTQEDEETSEES